LGGFILSTAVRASAARCAGQPSILFATNQRLQVYQLAKSGQKKATTRLQVSNYRKTKIRAQLEVGMAEQFLVVRSWLQIQQLQKFL
jgi:hypothetical protein